MTYRLTHQTLPASAQAVAPQGPKLDPPRVDIGISVEEWNVQAAQDVFRISSGIGDTQAPFQLFQCVGLELGNSLLKAIPDATAGRVATLLAAMCSLAVILVAMCILRTELLQLHQERDKAFHTLRWEG